MSVDINAMLQAWQDTLRLQSDHSDETPAEGLIYAGKIHDSVPRQLLLDPMLSPRDKLAWQILRLHAGSQHGATFPSYTALQTLLSTSPATESASRSTVSHSLTMLRLTRWLSLCQKHRDARTGRIIGNIYALHDAPLILHNARLLDSGYLQLLSDSTHHASKYLRLTAQAIWQVIFDDPAYRDLLSRLEQPKARPQISFQAPESSHRTGNTPGTLTGLSETLFETKKEITENSLSCPLVLSQNQGHVRKEVKRKRSSTQIQWPEGLPLTSAQRGAVWQAMSDLPAQLCHEVLESCSRRIVAGGISNPLGYILATLRKARQGEFNLYKRQKPERRRRTPLAPTDRSSNLIENLKYLCQQHKNRR